MSDHPPPPSLDDFLLLYEQNSKVWWTLSCGVHQALFEEAVSRGVGWPQDAPQRDDRASDVDANNLLATGALWHLLGQLTGANSALTSVTLPGVGNQIDVTMDFLKSPYRLTVERVPDREEHSDEH